MTKTQVIQASALTALGLAFTACGKKNNAIFIGVFTCLTAGWMLPLIAQDLPTDDEKQAEPKLPLEIVKDAAPETIPAAENTGVLIRDEVIPDRNWIDATHSWLYSTSQDTVVWLDTLLLEEEDVPVPTPPPRFRIGLFTQVELKPEGTTRVVPVADFDIDVDLPNLESRLKLFISTRDPTALPGDDPLDTETDLRVGASRSYFENWKTSAGIKAKWVPEPFVYVQWSPEISLGETWTMVPQIRPFWESEDGFGGITSAVFNRWKKRTIFRQTFSLKWSQKLEEEDADRAADEESPQFGDDGNGTRWDSTTIWGYVPLLLDERDYGRRVGGSDVAKGTGLKLRVSGNEIKTLETRLSLFNKGPVRKDFLYYILGPEVIWQDDQDWKEEYSIKFGFEMLLWGDATQR
jgi:hypothetical protein